MNLVLTTNKLIAYSGSKYILNKKIPIKGTVGRLVFWFKPTADFSGTSKFLKIKKPTGWNFD